MAILLLPPQCGDTVGSATCDTWWQLNGQLFRNYFQDYGTSVVLEAQLGGRVEQYSSWNAKLADTADGEKKLKADAKVDFTAATGLPAGTGTHDPAVTAKALVCIGGSNTTCTKAGISPGVNGAYAKSIDSSHKLLQYKLLPISELLDYTDVTIKLAMEQATQYYIQEQQQEWKDYYSKYQKCVAPFKCPHCPAGKCAPTPPPTPKPPPGTKV